MCAKCLFFYIVSFIAKTLRRGVKQKQFLCALAPLRLAVVFFIFISSLSTAQNNLIILDENGQEFFLFIDGKQINDSVQAEVQATNIYDDTCNVKILFHDTTIPSFSAKVFLELNAKSVSKRDFTYSISHEKGKEKLNFISVNYSQSDTTAKAQSPEAKIKSIFIAQAKQKEEQDRLNEIYPSPSPCIKIISDSLLQKNLKLLRDNHVDLIRMKDAKWFVSHNCINTVQLKKLISVFDYRNSKVKIAEFAYDYIEDHRNFLKVVDAMEFNSEKEELKKFYNKRIEK